MGTGILKWERTDVFESILFNEPTAWLWKSPIIFSVPKNPVKMDFWRSCSSFYSVSRLHEPKVSEAKYSLRRGKPLCLPFLYLTQTKNAINWGNPILVCSFTFQL